MIRSTFGDRANVIQVQGGHLGSRMQGALQRSMSNGHVKVGV